MTNVEGTRGCCDAAVAAGVQRVVHVSTDEVYGPCPDEPFREDQKLPGEGLATSPYARSKALADDLAHCLRGPPGRRRRPADQLHRAMAAPREGGAAVGHARAARRAAAGVGRRQAGARLDVRRRRGARACGCWPSGASAAPPTTWGRPARACRTSRSPAWSRAAAGRRRRRRLPERVRPAPARPPLRRLPRPHHARWAGGHRADARARPWPRRSPGTATTPTGGARSCPTRSGCMPTEIVPSPVDGVRIWRPQVHGDARGRFVEVFRSRGRAGADRPVESLPVGGRRPARPALSPPSGRPVVPRLRPRPGRAGRPAPPPVAAPMTQTFVLDGETPTDGLRPGGRRPRLPRADRDRPDLLGHARVRPRRRAGRRLERSHPGHRLAARRRAARERARRPKPAAAVGSDPRVLVTGAGGQVGRALRAHLPRRGLPRPRRPGRVRRRGRARGAAARGRGHAHRGHDRRRRLRARSRAAAFAVNAAGAANVAARGARVILLSTDYVFDGARRARLRRGRPHRAALRLRPLQARGRAGRARAGRATWSCARRGCTATGATSSARSSPPSARASRCGSSTTSAAGRPGPATSPRALAHLVAAGDDRDRARDRRRRALHVGRPGRARGRPSRCSGSRRPSSGRPRRGPRHERARPRPRARARRASGRLAPVGSTLPGG